MTVDDDLLRRWAASTDPERDPITGAEVREHTPVAPVGVVSGPPPNRRLGVLAVAAIVLLAGTAVVVGVVRRDSDRTVRTDTITGPDTKTSADPEKRCATELPLRPVSLPYQTPARPGPAPVPGAPAIDEGQLVLHWSDGAERAIEMRWPSPPMNTTEVVTGNLTVAGRTATIASIGALRHIVRVPLRSDGTSRCDELSILGYGTISRQIVDELTAFSESLVDASAPPPPITEPSIPECEAPPVTPSAREMTIKVFLYCGPPNPRSRIAANRAMPETETPLRAALEQLMAGTTPEEDAAGLTSGVPEQVQGAPVRVTIDDAGVATVDIDYDFATVNNFSTSNVTIGFVDPIYATVLQFETVNGVDLGRFCDYTELTCEVMTRAELERHLQG